MTMLRFSTVLLGAVCALPAGVALAESPDDWFAQHGRPPAPTAASVKAPPLAPRPPDPPAYAWKPVRLSISIESSTRWMLPDATRALWGQKAQEGGGLAVQYEAFRLGPTRTVALDLALVSHKSTHWNAASIRQETEDKRLALGASLAHSLWSWCAPYGRVAVGVGSTKLTLGNQSTSLSDTRRFVEGTIGAGVALRAPSLRLGRTSESLHVTGILRVEGGYLVGNSQAFALRADAPTGEEAPIPVSSVAVGSAPHRAPYLRIAFGLGF